MLPEPLPPAVGKVSVVAESADRISRYRDEIETPGPDRFVRSWGSGFARHRNRILRGNTGSPLFLDRESGIAAGDSLCKVQPHIDGGGYPSCGNHMIVIHHAILRNLSCEFFEDLHQGRVRGGTPGLKHPAAPARRAPPTQTASNGCFTRRNGKPPDKLPVADEIGDTVSAR